jgi:hypothetical protein
MPNLRGVAHVHSTHSFDGRLPLADLASFFQEQRLDFVLLSEHVESLDAPKVASLIAECAALSSPSFLLIPGIEIDALHALFYGVTSITPWESNEDLAAQLAAGGALVAVSHPVKVRQLPPFTLAHAEAVEVWNSRHDGKTALDLRIVRFWTDLRARLQRGLIPLCGIDFHSRRDFIPLVMEVSASSFSAPEVVAALKAGRYRISLAGRTVPLDFSTGRRPFGYRAYSTIYRLCYKLVYAAHRATLDAGFRLPSGLKALLRDRF